MQAPVMVLNTNTQRESGQKAQISNIMAAKTVADIIRTTLGPRSMLKMILDPMGGITLTNDGNCILREIDVSHPAAKNMIEMSRTQDEEVGDGTTSVIILAGELLNLAQEYIERKMHPKIIVGAYMQALDIALDVLDKNAKPLDTDNDEEMLQLIKSCIGTKFSARMGDLLCQLALKAVKIVAVDPQGDEKEKEIDVKNCARVEVIPGGYLKNSRVLDGIMINKDVTHPEMRRKIEDPRIVLLDCPLEYNKGESETIHEIKNSKQFNRILEIEEESIKAMCEEIARVKPDLVFTEKGVSDLAQHYLLKKGITVFRRVRKADMNRISKAVGGQILHRPEELKEKHVGTKCGLFTVKKIGDEYFTFLVKCKDPKACTIVLRGGSKDVLKEINRNLNDAMSVARSILLDPRILTGGGSVEMRISAVLRKEAKKVKGVKQYPFLSVADALEVIPKTLIENSGKLPIRLLTKLRVKHLKSDKLWGVDGEEGEIADIEELKIWEPYLVKSQTIKTAFECACMLLRIDDIVSGVSKSQ